MAIAWVQTKAGVTGDTTIVARLDTQPIVGNTLIVAAASWQGSPTAQVSGIVDDGSNTWARAIRANLGVNVEAEIWYAYVANTAANFDVTVTWGKAGSGVNFVVCEYSGILNPSPLDGTALLDGTGTTPTVGPVVPTGNALYAACISTKNTTITKGAAYTGRYVEQSNNTIDMEYEDLISSGSKSADWTIGADLPSACVLAAFKEAGGTGDVAAIVASASANIPAHSSSVIYSGSILPTITL
jgi:hypothetical protein